MNIQCPSQWIKSILISFIFICITPFSIAEASSDEQSSLVNIFQVEALSNSGTPYTIVDQFLFTSETINDYYPIGDLEHQVVVKKWDLTKSQLIDTYQFNYIGSSDYEPRLKAYDVSMNAMH